MNNINKKKFWPIIITITVLGILFIFFGFFYKANIIFYYDFPPYQVYNSKTKESYECKNTQCKIVTTPGNHSFILEKKGFFPVEQNIYMPILNTYHQVIEFEKIPEIKKTGLISNNFPPQIIDPQQKNKTYQVKADFNTDNTIVFKKNIIIKDAKNFSVSTDEIGRNIWIFSPEKIRRYNIQTKQIFFVQDSKIDQIYPMKNGDITWKEGDNFIWYQTKNRQQVKIPKDFDVFGAFIPWGKNGLIGIKSYTNIRGKLIYWNGTSTKTQDLLEVPVFQKENFLFLSSNIQGNILIGYKDGSVFEVQL